MAWLLDTCVLSEPTRPSPNPEVVAFLGKLDLNEAYISVISVAEIWKGIHKLPRSRRRTALERWLREELLPGFPNIPLPIDLDVARKWGETRADLDAEGNAMPAIDCLLAATAMVHNLILVTRNDRHFIRCGVELFNPWK